MVNCIVASVSSDCRLDLAVTEPFAQFFYPLSAFLVDFDEFAHNYLPMQKRLTC